MAIKKENVNLTYDALWFKTFMDSGELTFYNREIFISPGMAGRLDIFMQLLGNVRADMPEPRTSTKTLTS